MRQCLEDDTNNIFKNEYIRNCPKANFRDIALATFSGKSWEEISQEMDVKISTLSSFFQRSCKKFAPQFQEYF
jgi:DNA-directed RNA polymerase specialized sigma24 family protein